MSRALDKDVAASLAKGDHNEAYEQISGCLVQSTQDDGRLDIEILGRNHPVPPGTHFLRDGNAIAVPKLSLVRAFLVARVRLKEYLAEKQKRTLFMVSPPGGKSGDTGCSVERASAATAVILLMDPEHLTAANTRKRVLLLARTTVTPGCFAEMAKREVRFIDSLLTSRLHRHTKSPTLWSHRRWLIQTCHFSTSILSPEPTAKFVLNSLVEVVMVAAERHPTNYYAWWHARWLMSVLPLAGIGEEPHNLFAIIDAAKAWAFRHYTDTSGWSFLSYVLCALSHPIRVSEKLRVSIFLETIKLSRSLKWTNESVWVFLRTMAASGLVGTEATESFRTLGRALACELAVGSVERRTIQRAEEWVDTYG